NYWCDSPWLLINDSIDAMKNVKPDPDFILWTGTDLNLATIQNITSKLQESFPGTVTYATLGNNDYYPKDQFPTTTNKLYVGVSIMWSDWLKETDQIQSMKRVGYYSLKTKHGLRIFGLNTNHFYSANKMTANLTDPAGQLTWLDQQLTAAKSNNEKVS
ncbi:acid sphingomyelinase-like phosphodiesterase 3b, partial [Patella vulgata]|uniref:acid sphingomyelinase-like phosphodiesterase 3b n=1 Tax=Patella vulgata TaxID=6465 RepID=UPI00217FAA36